jgi:putative hydrolase of the HAD superfamily
MPGAGATLAALRRGGLPLGIVSNAQFYTPWLFPVHFGAGLRALGFRPRLCAWSYRSRCAKPSASLFRGPLRSLQRRGIPASATLVVGNDRRNDIDPAVRLGCRTALFAGDARSYRPREGEADRLEPPGRSPEPAADLLLAALPQLLEALGENLLSGRPGVRIL